MQALTDFFDILFRSNAPEVQKKIKLRKIERFNNMFFCSSVKI